jgi:hypothetical protein
VKEQLVDAPANDLARRQPESGQVLEAMPMLRDREQGRVASWDEHCVLISLEHVLEAIDEGGNALPRIGQPDPLGAVA